MKLLQKRLQPDMCTVLEWEKREVDETTAETLQKHQTQVSQVTLTVEYQQESHRVMTSVQPARAPCPEFSIQVCKLTLFIPAHYCYLIKCYLFYGHQSVTL